LTGIKIRKIVYVNEKDKLAEETKMLNFFNDIEDQQLIVIQSFDRSKAIEAGILKMTKDKVNYVVDLFAYRENHNLHQSGTLVCLPYKNSINELQIMHSGHILSYLQTFHQSSLTTSLSLKYGKVFNDDRINMIYSTHDIKNITLPEVVALINQERPLNMTLNDLISKLEKIHNYGHLEDLHLNFIIEENEGVPFNINIFKNEDRYRPVYHYYHKDNELCIYIMKNVEDGKTEINYYLLKKKYAENKQTTFERFKDPVIIADPSFTTVNYSKNGYLLDYFIERYNSDFINYKQKT
jgi:hypothetical protein